MSECRCSVEGCVKPVRPKRTVCSMHEARRRRTGTVDPSDVTHASLADRLWRRVQKTDGCWLWIGWRNNNGYGSIGTKVAGRKTRIYTHRASYEIHNGPIPAGLVVRHSCDTPACVNPDHLQLGTQADNIRDMYERGRR